MENGAGGLITTDGSCLVRDQAGFFRDQPNLLSLNAEDGKHAQLLHKVEIP